MRSDTPTRDSIPSLGELLPFYAIGSALVGTCGWLFSTQSPWVAVTSLTTAAVAADVVRRVLPRNYSYGRRIRESVVLLKTMFSILRWSDEPGLWTVRFARLPIIASAALGVIAGTVQLTPENRVLPVAVILSVIGLLVISALLGEHERVRLIRALMRRSDALNAVTSWLSENAQALSRAGHGGDREVASVFLRSMKFLTDDSLWRKDVTFHLWLPFYNAHARWPQSKDFDEAHEQVITRLSSECLLNARSAYLPRTNSRFVVFGLADDLPKIEVSLWAMPENTRFRGKSLLCVPIMANSRPCGVLTVQGDRMDAFSSTDAQFLKSIGTILAETLEVARAVSDTSPSPSESKELPAPRGRLGESHSMIAKSGTIRLMEPIGATSKAELTARATVLTFMQALREVIRPGGRLALMSREK